MNAKDLFPDLVIPVYYSIDDNGFVLIDEESMQEEFDQKLAKAKANSKMRIME